LMTLQNSGVRLGAHAGLQQHTAAHTAGPHSGWARLTE
jgi:hypothetical protein